MALFSACAPPEQRFCVDMIETITECAPDSDFADRYDLCPMRLPFSRVVNYMTLREGYQCMADQYCAEEDWERAARWCGSVSEDWRDPS